MPKAHGMFRLFTGPRGCKQLATHASCVNSGSYATILDHLGAARDDCG